MAFFKVVIEERRQKTLIIEAPDRELATGQYDAGVFGDLPKEDSDKFVFTDYDHNVDYENRLVSIKETDMETETEFAYDCVFWNDEQNCITEGWCEGD